MAADSESKAPRPWTARLRARLRTRFTAGLILILPVWLTWLLVSFIFRLLRDASLWVVEGLLGSRYGAPLVERWGIAAEDLRRIGIELLPVGVQWTIGVLCVVMTLVTVYLVGSITANLLGRRVVGGVESLVDRVPLVKTVYRASKQVLELFASRPSGGFQRVVMIPFPSREVQSVGFVTSRTVDRATGQEYCAVFIATTPNPTTGFVFIVKRTDVVELDWTLEEAIKVVMSGGALLADRVSFTPRLGPAARS